MSSAGGIRAGKSYIEIATDNSKLLSGLRSAQNTLKSWGAGLQSLGGGIFKPLALAGAGGFAGLVAIGQSLGDLGGQIDDISQRTGMSTEAVSELGYAAQMSGTDLGTLEGGLSKMQKLTSEAASGSKSAAGQLRELGLSAANLAGLTPDQQMAAFADAIAKLKSPADRVNAAMSVFGKSGQKLLPLLQGGAAGLQEMRDRAKELGLSMSGPDAKAAAELGDALDEMKAAGRAAAFSLGGALAPALKTLFTIIANVTGGVSLWIRENRTLLVVGVAIAATLMAAGAAVYGLGVAFSVLGIAIGIAKVLLIGLGAVLGFLVSTPGLIIAGLVALAGWFLYTSGIGSQALTWLGEAWATLAGDATSAWGGIVAAIGAGDLQAAFAVAMAYLNLQWVRATNLFWSAWNSASLQIEVAWLNTTTEMANAWSAFVSGLVTEFVRASDIITPLAAAIAERIGGKNLATAYRAAGSAAVGFAAGTQGSTDRAIGDRNKARDQRLAELQSRSSAAPGTLTAEEVALATAQEALRNAVAKAQGNVAGKSTDAPTVAAPPSGTLQAGVDKARKTAAAASDVRSQEGQKALLQAFGVGGDPQQKIADNTKIAADEAVKQRVELERIRRNQEGPAEDEEPADLG